MKLIRIIFITSFVLSAGFAEVSYPDFHSAWWSTAADQSAGKKKRGIFGLTAGAGGLAWTAAAWKKSATAPDKYIPLGIAGSLAFFSLGGHGLGSWVLGNKEIDESKSMAQLFENGDASDAQSQELYRIQRMRSFNKMKIFGGFLITEGVILLGNMTSHIIYRYENAEIGKRRPVGLGIWGSLLVAGGLYTGIANGKKYSEFAASGNKGSGRPWLTGMGMSTLVLSPIPLITSIIFLGKIQTGLKENNLLSTKMKLRLSMYYTSLGLSAAMVYFGIKWIRDGRQPKVRVSQDVQSSLDTAFTGAPLLIIQPDFAFLGWSRQF